MPKIDDHEYVKTCAKLASCLSISIASARRKVELEAMRKGVRDLSGRKIIADKLLNLAESSIRKGVDDVATRFNDLLSALSEEENFMTED